MATPKLRPYRRGNAPSLGDYQTFIQGELKKIEQSIALLVTKVEDLEARIVALETP